MAVETDTDRSAFLADFGQAITIADGSPTETFTAIFDNAYITAEFGAAVGVASREPVLLARTTDVSSLANDTSLTIGGVSYLLKRQEPDGTGISTLILEIV